MKTLRAHRGTAAMAMEFIVLTAARTGEATAKMGRDRHRSKIWVVPAGRMKAGREHRVPLSDRAVEMLRVAAREGNGLRIHRREEGQPLSNMALPHAASAHGGRRLTDARLSVELSRLGRGEDGLSERDGRNGLGSRHQGQGRSGLSARRHGREAAAPDGRLGRLLHGGFGGNPPWLCRAYPEQGQCVRRWMSW